FAPDPFPNNQSPTQLLNPAAQFLAATYPQPNLTTVGAQPNLINTDPVVTVSDQFGTRVDAALTDKTTLFGRFSYDNTTRSLPQTIPSYPDIQDQTGVQQVLGLTHIFSSTSVLDLRAQYLRSSITIKAKEPVLSQWVSTGLINDYPGEIGLGIIYPNVPISD